MASVSIDWVKSRDMMVRTIVDAIREWPEKDRSMFIQAHYRGLNLEEISHSSGMKVSEVRRILGQCERRLHDALRRFRGRKTASLEQ